MPRKKRITLPQVKQLPSGSWNCTVYLGNDENGKRVYKSITASTPEECQRQALTVKADKRVQKIVDTSPLTVGQAIDRYIDSLRGSVADDTVNTYRMARRNHLQSIMNVRVTDLTAAHLQNAVSADRKRLNSRTVSNALSLTRRAVQAVRPDFNPAITVKPSAHKEVEIPEDDEVSRILQATYGTEMEIPCYLSLLCGLRRSEICGLKWEDVDLDAGLLHIRRALVVTDRQLLEKEPKTPTSKRTVKLPQPVLDCLRDHRDDPLGNDPYIVIHPDHVSHRFNNLLKKLGIPHKRFHAGRHFVVSTLYEQNFPEKYVADFMGHSTTQMVNRVYTHLKNETRSQVDDSVSTTMQTLFPRKKK